MDISLDDTGLARAQVPNNQNLIQVFFLSLSSLHTHTHTTDLYSEHCMATHYTAPHTGFSSSDESQCNPPSYKTGVPPPNPRSQYTHHSFLVQYSTSAIVRGY